MERKHLRVVTDSFDGPKPSTDLFVPTDPYGSEGLIPMAGCCPIYDDDGISCAGSSGDNFCGGYMGQLTEPKRNRVYVLCGEGSLK